MKNLAIITIALITFLIPITIKAQPPFPNGVSGINGCNLHNENITINATYYQNTGGGVWVLPPVLVEPLKCNLYFNQPSSIFSSGSSILTSNNGRVGGNTNTTYDNNKKGAAYDGVNKGSKEIVIPLFTGNFFGQSTFVSIQNTDTSNSTSVDFTFTEQGGLSFTRPFTIAPGLTKFFDPTGDPSFISWLGSLTVKSGASNIAGVAFNYTSNNVGAYTGISKLDNEVFVPLVRSNFANFTTGVQVASSVNITNTVIISYSGVTYNEFFNIIDPNYTCSVEATIPPNSSITFFNGLTTPFDSVFGAGSASKVGGDCFTLGHNSFSNAGNKFLGGAIVASFNGGISSIVNDSGGNSSGIYNSFIIDDASDYIFSPLSRVEFPSGIRTGHQIQNICSTVITVDVLYITNTDFTVVPAPTAGPFVIQPGTSATAFIPPGSGFDGWIGTFTAKTQGGERCIVGITNDQVDNFDSSVFNLIKINE